MSLWISACPVMILMESEVSVMSNERPRVEIRKATCPYCGKTRTYDYRAAYTEPDYSHGWPDREISEVNGDKGCDCLLGKLAQEGGKIPIKPQCANCAHNRNNCCTSEAERDAIAGPFGLTGPLRILDPYRSCEHWTISGELFVPFLRILE